MTDTLEIWSDKLATEPGLCYLVLSFILISPLAGIPPFPSLIFQWTRSDIIFTKFILHITSWYYYVTLLYVTVTSRTAIINCLEFKQFAEVTLLFLSWFWLILILYFQEVKYFGSQNFRIAIECLWLGLDWCAGVQNLMQQKGNWWDLSLTLGFKMLALT